jgi:hypothetical protein
MVAAAIVAGPKNARQDVRNGKYRAFYEITASSRITGR